MTFSPALSLNHRPLRRAASAFLLAALGLGASASAQSARPAAEPASVHEFMPVHTAPLLPSRVHRLGTAAVSTTTLNTSAASLAAGSVLTLTATVNNGGAAGQVKFCDLGTGTSCTFLHILSTQQLVAGTATYKFIPPPGTHTYQAVFLGTPGAGTPYGSSTSPNATVTVSGSNSSVNLSSTGSAGNYTLTANVTGQRPSAPTGSVVFKNTTNNTVVGTAPLSAATSSTTSFAGSSLNTTGFTPTTVVLADFNNDGKLDEAIITPGSRSLTVLYGDGTGHFGAALNVPTSPIAELSGLAVGDFNNDGLPDLVCVLDTTSIQVFLNNGSGGFNLQPPIAVGKQDTDVQVADFDLDGNADLVVTDNANSYLTNNQQQGAVYILKGSGSGTFTLASTTLAGISSLTSAVGDFNGDGIPDLAVANVGSSVNVASRTVSILLGAGDSTFTRAQTLFFYSVSGYLAVGDFNGDGLADVATANGATSTVTVDFNSGNNTPQNLFSLYYTSPVAGNPSQLAVADYNGDGFPDLAVTYTGAHTFSILANSGVGKFTPLAVLPAGNMPLFIAAGDLNGDGIPDTVITNYADNTSEAFLTLGTATAQAQLSAVAVRGNGTASVTATYSGDTNLSPSTSAPITVQASTDATSTALTSITPATTTLGGASVKLSAVVQDTTNTSVYPSGTVTFTDSTGSNTNTRNGVQVVNGVASINYTPLTAGSHRITATFVPDAGFTSSADSTGQQLTVNPANLTASGGLNFSVVQGSSTILSFIVNFPAAVPPTGTLQATVNGSTVGLGTPTCVTKNGSGPHRNCSFPYNDTLPPGKYTVTFSQGSDSNYNFSPTVYDILTVTPLTY